MKRVILFLTVVFIFTFSLNSAIAKGGKGSKGGSSISKGASRSSNRKSVTSKLQKTTQAKPAKKVKAKPVKKVKAKPAKQKAQKPLKDTDKEKPKGKVGSGQEHTGSKGKGASKDKDAKKDSGKKADKENKKDKVKGKDKQQQLKAVKKQIAHETDKHMTRAARFERLRELAQGDKKTLERINKLAEREQQRFDTKTQRLQQRELSPGQPDSEVKTKTKGKSKTKDKAEDKPENEGE